jgi:uncharacterized damage-inducible protein DinB
MEAELVETWQINHRINLYLLDAIAPEALPSVPLAKGRSVAQQFAHVHAVRLMWLKAAAPELLAGLEKVETDSALGKPVLREALTKSGAAIDALLRKGLENKGRIKGFKPHAVAFLGYLIAHEAHHRGQINMTLKQAGHPLDKKTSYGLWEWGVR